MTADVPLAEFLDAVEAHNGKPFRHRQAVESLLRGARDRSLEQVFSDAIFQATFVVKTRDVMKRIGTGAEGFDTLSAQFSEGVERVSTLVRTILKEGPEDEKRYFSESFFSMEQEGLGRLLDLMADLALIKHWEVDGHSLPFPGYTKVKHAVQEQEGVHHQKNITRAARLALILLIVLLIVDGPFTILGWAIALIVAALLIVIQFEAMAARRKAS